MNKKLNTETTADDLLMLPDIDGIVKDIRPGSDHSPIFAGVTPIPSFIRINSDAEGSATYATTMTVNTTAAA